MEFHLVTDLHVTDEERRDYRMYLFMAQVRDKISFQVSTPLTDSLESLFLHTAHPNPNDCGRKDSGDPEE